ncbi:MAG: cytoplasmic protein [Roseibium sp.]
MRIVRSSRLILSALAVCATVAAPALAEEHRAYFSFGGEKRLPDCTASSVQSRVAGSIARTSRNYGSGEKILEIEDIREVSYEKNGVSPLARRFCRGKASLSDGSYQSVHYMVEENAGFVGISWNVEACMTPLDDWRVYGAYCSTTRPR